MLVLFFDWAAIGEILHSTGKLTSVEHEKMKSSVGLWSVIIPLVFGGVGVNVLSAWLTTKRPLVD